jgi:hypothetical protein
MSDPGSLSSGTCNPTGRPGREMRQAQVEITFPGHLERKV